MQFMIAFLNKDIEMAKIETEIFFSNPDLQFGSVKNH